MAQQTWAEPTVREQWRRFFDALGISYDFAYADGGSWRPQFRLQRGLPVIGRDDRPVWLHYVGPAGLDANLRGIVRSFVSRTRQSVILVHSPPAMSVTMTYVYYSARLDGPAHRPVSWCWDKGNTLSLATVHDLDMREPTAFKAHHKAAESARLANAFSKATHIGPARLRLIPARRPARTTADTAALALFSVIVIAALLVMPSAIRECMLEPMQCIMPNTATPTSSSITIEKAEITTPSVVSPTNTSAPIYTSDTLVPTAASASTLTLKPTDTPEPIFSPSPTSVVVLEKAHDPEAITVVSWNVESGGADPAVIANQIARFEGVDLWGLVEVNTEKDQNIFEDAAGAEFASIISESGGGDRVMAMYDTRRFDLLRHEEISHINTTGDARAPLVLKLSERSIGVEFLFVVNHLYRSKDEERRRQAQLLNAWAEQQSIPIIAVGDYNLDWDVNAGCAIHDVAYDHLTERGVFHWIRPTDLVTTQCSGWPCKYESVLDFILTAGEARYWETQSEIIQVPGDFPDDEHTSDHRPIAAYFLPKSQRGVTATTQDTAFYAAPEYGSVIIEQVESGKIVEPIGRTADNAWLQLYCGEWLPARYAALSFPISSLTVVDYVSRDGGIGSRGLGQVSITDEQAEEGIYLKVLINDGFEEIIGIVNNTQTTLNVGGWNLSGEYGDDQCVLPDATQIQPGQTYTVATGKSNYEGHGYKCRSDTIWRNSGETAWLRDTQGNVVAELYVSRQGR